MDISLALDPPAIGEIVRVRSRRYLVEAVTPASNPGDDALVRLSCLEDDAEGEELGQQRAIRGRFAIHEGHPRAGASIRA